MGKNVLENVCTALQYTFLVKYNWMKLNKLHLGSSFITFMGNISQYGKYLTKYKENNFQYV
jgi:hypothetical protein